MLTDLSDARSQQASDAEDSGAKFRLGNERSRFCHVRGGCARSPHPWHRMPHQGPDGRVLPGMRHDTGMDLAALASAAGGTLLSSPLLGAPSCIRRDSLGRRTEAVAAFCLGGVPRGAPRRLGREDGHAGRHVADCTQHRKRGCRQHRDALVDETPPLNTAIQLWISDGGERRSRGSGHGNAILSGRLAKGTGKTALRGSEGVPGRNPCDRGAALCRAIRDWGNK